MVAVLVLLGLGVLTALAPALVAWRGRDAGFLLAGGFALGAVAVGTLTPEVLAGEVLQVSVPWVPSIALELAFRVDGLALLFAFLVLGVGALVMWYCARYFSPESPGRRVYALLTAFAAAMLGLVLADDVVLLFVFWEATSVLSFFLIGGDGRAGRRPATRAFLVTGVGGLALLAAAVLITVAAGTSSLSAVLADPDRVLTSPYAPAIGALLVLAAFTKSAQVPFHFWLPGAMVAATPVSAYLHAATMVKAGVYLLMRFSAVFAGVPAWTDTLVLVGLATAIYGALVALEQHDLKALLAYSTVSQLGWLIALVGIGTPLALAAAALHTAAHALFKASLFMLVGIVDKEVGSRDIRELSGLHRVMPRTAAVTGLAALSMAGVPPFLGFVSKEEAFKAFLDGGGAWLGPSAAALAVVAAVLTFSYGWRLFTGAFTGPTEQPDLYEPSRAFLAPAAVAAVAGLLAGPAVPLLDPLMSRAMGEALQVPGPVAVDLALWHGVTVPLALSAVVIAVGTGLYVVRDRVDRVLTAKSLPWYGPAVFDRLYDALLRLGAVVGRPSATAPAPTLVALPLAAAGAVGLAVLLTGQGSGWTDLPPVRDGTTRPADWLVVVALALLVVAAVRARDRLAAVTLVGLVGFALCVWYLLLGAPDLALTQLLVETLTVVIAVLVLHPLPSRFPAEPRRGRVARLGLALGLGGLAAAGTALLTGRRELSAVGDYLLRNADAQTGGSNVVNTVLVDFRSLDTLGEIAVLGLVGTGLALLLRPARPGPVPTERVVRTAERALVPSILLLSAFLLLRGHDEPGGGFIAALVAGAAAVLWYFARGTAGLSRLRPTPLIAVGLLVALGAGIGGALTTGEFLGRVGGVSVPLPVVGTVGLGSALVFDLGVLLVVLGLVVAILRSFGGVLVRPDERAPRPEAELGQRTEVR